MKYKTIHDPIHGSIKMEGFLLALLETPEVQKLHGIHQLGLAYLVFPGAHHTRLEHSLGVCHFAKRMSEELNLPKEERLTVQAAGLLHDLGHGPYSHTLEHVLHMKLGIDHMELTKDIITGKHDSIKDLKEGRERIHEILENAGLDPKKVASLVTGDDGKDNENNIELFSKEKRDEKKYLAQIIHSPIDADQIDYLLRDSHYTGVAAGTIDNHRLLQTLALHNGELVITKGGINALEGMLVARALMYSTVYFHKTVRIAEGMLARAVERIEKDRMLEFQSMIDSEFWSEMYSLGGFQRETILRIKYRNLFKKAFAIMVKDIKEMDEASRERLASLDNDKKRRQAEDEICKKAKIPEGYVVLDLPKKELFLSEPRIHKTDVKILENKKLRPLSKYSPLARSLQLRTVPDWALMVSTDKKYKEQVAKAAKRVLL